MPRTALTKTPAPGPYASAGAALTMSPADTVELNEFIAQGKDLVIAHNTGATPHTVTITSAPDPYGRTGHIAAEAIPAGQIRIYGPLEIAGWMQPDGRIYLQSDSAEVRFGVVKLPG